MLKNMNLPNKLTVARIVMIPFFMVAMMLTKAVESEGVKTGLYLFSAFLFLAASATDFVDGKIARKYNLITSFGKFMDPLADKFMVIGAYLAAIYVYEDMRLWLVITTAVTVFRELAVSGIRLIAVTGDNVVIAAAMPGKIKTFSQCILVELMILEPMIFSAIGFDTLARYTPLTYICMAVVVFFTIYSGMQYIIGYKKYITF